MREKQRNISLFLVESKLPNDIILSYDFNMFACVLFYHTFFLPRTTHGTRAGASSFPNESQILII